VSSLGALGQGPSTKSKTIKLTSKQKISLSLKRMVMAALKGTRVARLKLIGWWKEPRDMNDQYLQKDLDGHIFRDTK
jgi:hypothetical protein